MVVLFGNEKTREYSGITKNFFDEYFKDRKVAYAYKLGKIKVYDEPKALAESDHRTLEYILDRYGSNGWKLINVVWNNDESLLIATMMREKE